MRSPKTVFLPNQIRAGAVGVEPTGPKRTTVLQTAPAPYGSTHPSFLQKNKTRTFQLYKLYNLRIPDSAGKGVFLHTPLLIYTRTQQRTSTQLVPSGLSSTSKKSSFLSSSLSYVQHQIILPCLFFHSNIFL